MVRSAILASAAVLALAIDQDSCSQREPEVAETMSILQHGRVKDREQMVATSASTGVPPAVFGFDAMSEFKAGVCGVDGKDTRRTVHLPGQHTPAQCRIECAKDPLCTAAEMPSSTFTGEEVRGWCALFYHSESIASNNNFACAHKTSRMKNFETGVCGRPRDDGNGFQDTGHTMDMPEFPGEEGQHLQGEYTPLECLQKCALDPACHGAEQKKSRLASDGKSWCALFYTTDKVTEIGVAANENFNCALKERFPKLEAIAMVDFETGVCGRQNGQGGFEDTHHTVHGEAGQEGVHLDGTYTPGECSGKCSEDINCRGAEQPATLTDGKAWCALFYLTNAVTEIGIVVTNVDFKCALKTLSRPQLW